MIDPTDPPAPLPLEALPESASPESLSDEASPSDLAVMEEDEWEEVEVDEPTDGPATSLTDQPVKVRRRKRVFRTDAEELRLLGRRALCPTIADIAPNMLKLVKLRILGNFLPSTRGIEEEELTEILKKQATKLSERTRILTAINTPDLEYDRGELRWLLLTLLVQEETYSMEENRLDTKAIEFEKQLVKRSKDFDLTELKKSDPDRWHQFDTYRIVLQAAWTNDNSVSADEAKLLAVLREHLGISLEEHWLISALIKRFPKDKGALHTPDELNNARKELQRAGILWSYRDETSRLIDVIPGEIATIIRKDVFALELQRTNLRRLLNHDGLMLATLRDVLQAHAMDRSGNKAELIERLGCSDVKPSAVLNQLDKEKLASVCASLNLKTSGSKAELIERLIAFYDDLTFEERVAKDKRAEWYSNYELLGSRKYAELRAKKVISKELDIQTLFENATTFLFEVRLKAKCDRAFKDNRSDGRIHIDDHQCLLWDCKSAEETVNLQDHLDGQFDGYLRKEKEVGKQPLAFIVIGPAFTPQSIILAHQYKARTNWDIALVTAEGLKHLAERWVATEPDKPFPTQLFNRTDVIDKERAEFLLSLA